MKQGEQTRNKILKSAGKLFYQHGFHQTAFSDIVHDTGLSKGNITYHFKSKEDILNGVFEQRIENTHASLTNLDKKYPDAALRIEGFIDSLLKGKSELTRYGCRNGSLAYELGKSNNKTRELSRQVFDLTRHWLKKQFLALGFSTEQAGDRAMELFTRGQGICVISQVYSDEKLFEHEVTQLKTLIHNP
ncbi:MAG: TetR/AcrR family transcriptional regulator [Methylophaga sp.]|nr:TetR/AcrR family transcriptional regulator [Methylophaga sp.]